LFVPAISGNSIRGQTYTGPFNYPETDLYFGALTLFFVLASLFSRQRKLAWGFFGLGMVALLAVYNVSPLRLIISYLYPIFLNTFPGRIFWWLCRPSRLV
jgi:hypothetical protein